MTDNLFARAGELKEQLVAYALRPRYDRALGEVLADFGVTRIPELAASGPIEEEEERLLLALDHFVLQHRLRNGRTVVEQFVGSRSDLPEHEQAMLLGWRDVVDGVFEVEGRAGDGVEAVNLVDDLPYIIRSNMGAEPIAQAQRGWFLVTSVVPIDDEWMISGISILQPPSESDWALETALRIMTEYPEAVYRNPAKLERAWELQRMDRERFIRFFGSDTLVLPGVELQARMDAYWHFARSEAPDGEAGGSNPVMEFPVELTSSPAVAAIHDDVDGLSYYAHYGLVREVFDDPELARDGEHRQLLLAYLDDETIYPSLLRRLAGADQNRASRVFQILLGKPEFSWEHDGEALLRERKAEYFGIEPLPAVTPVSERLAAVATRQRSL